MMSKQQKDVYWSMVAECLVAFHDYSNRDAFQRVNSYRVEIEGAEPSIKSDIFYHNEPFDVACDINNKYINIKDYHDQYLAILERKPDRLKP